MPQDPMSEIESEAASFIVRNYYDPRGKRIRSDRYAASMSLLALLRLAKDGVFEDSILDEAANWLWKELEHSLSHWSGSVGDLSCLLLVLMEWHNLRGSPKDTSVIKTALELLRDFIWSGSERSFQRLEPTALAVMAMSRACQIGFASEKDLGRALERAESIIRKEQTFDGGWGFVSYRSNPASTGLALLALTALGKKKEDVPVRTGVKWLVANQREDGSWDATIEAFLGAQSQEISIPWLSTAYAIRALVHSGVPGVESHVISGVRHLISTQTRGGWSFLSGRPGGVTLRNTAEALLALADLAPAGFTTEKIVRHSLERRYGRYRMIAQTSAAVFGFVVAMLGSLGAFLPLVISISALAGSVAAFFLVRPR